MGAMVSEIAWRSGRPPPPPPPPLGKGEGTKRLGKGMNKNVFLVEPYPCWGEGAEAQAEKDRMEHGALPWAGLP